MHTEKIARLIRTNPKYAWMSHCGGLKKPGKERGVSSNHGMDKVGRAIASWRLVDGSKFVPLIWKQLCCSTNMNSRAVGSRFYLEYYMVVNWPYSFAGGCPSSRAKRVNK